MWQRGVELFANGTLNSPIAGNVVTPGHAATGRVTPGDDSFLYEIRLSASGWDRDTRLRPGWLQIRVGSGIWPDLPQPEGRLNLGSVQGDRFGRIRRVIRR